MKTNRVLRVPSLAAFTQEVPPANGKQAVVRLTATESFLPLGKTAIPRKNVGLSLQGVNAEGDVVWLAESHVIIWMPDGPGFEDDRSIYAGITDLKDIVRNHLKSIGYEVREGDYALPRGIQPLNAHFECARWVKLDDRRWQPQPQAAACKG